MDIHKNLERMKLVAMAQAKSHGCNYNIIIQNPDDDGKFDIGTSTYEMVADSYLEKPRPFMLLITTTNELFVDERARKELTDEQYELEYQGLFLQDKLRYMESPIGFKA